MPNEEEQKEPVQVFMLPSTIKSLKQWAQQEDTTISAIANKLVLERLEEIGEATKIPNDELPPEEQAPPGPSPEELKEANDNG